MMAANNGFPVFEGLVRKCSSCGGVEIHVSRETADRLSRILLSQVLEALFVAPRDKAFVTEFIGSINAATGNG
jgi:hypothetical protein